MNEPTDRVTLTIAEAGPPARSLALVMARRRAEAIAATMRAEAAPRFTITIEPIRSDPE